MDMVPKLMDDVQSMNVINIASDYATLSSTYTKFDSKCVNHSAECSSLTDALVQNVTSALSLIHSKDVTEIKAKANELVDQGFDYKDKCIGVQAFNVKKALRLLALQLSKM